MYKQLQDKIEKQFSRNPQVNTQCITPQVISFVSILEESTINSLNITAQNEGSISRVMVECESFQLEYTRDVGSLTLTLIYKQALEIEPFSQDYTQLLLNKLTCQANTPVICSMENRHNNYSIVLCTSLIIDKDNNNSAIVQRLSYTMAKMIKDICLHLEKYSLDRDMFPQARRLKSKLINMKNLSRVEADKATFQNGQ